MLILAVIILILGECFNLTSAGFPEGVFPPIPGDYMKDGKFIPRSIVLSATLGLPNEAASKSSRDSFEDTHSPADFVIPNTEAVKRPRKTELTFGGKTENINFYTIKCTNKEPCTSIIPTQEKKPPAPENNRTPREMRDYIVSHGLENGFQYTGDKEKDEQNVLAKFIKEIDDDVKEERTARKISNYNLDSNFWPGHEYRPRRPIPDKPSKAQVLKFENRPLSLSNETPQFYRKEYSKRGNRETHNYDRIPRPTFDDSLNWPYGPSTPSYDNSVKSSYGPPTKNFDDQIHFSYGLPHPSEYFPKRTTTQRTNKIGHWNKFYSSNVAKYNPVDGKWVKISTSDNSYPNNNYEYDSNTYGYNHDRNKKKYYQNKNPHQHTKNSHSASVGLTVLGINEEKNHAGSTKWVSDKTGSGNSDMNENYIDYPKKIELGNTNSSYTGYVTPFYSYPTIPTINITPFPNYEAPLLNYTAPKLETTTTTTTTTTTITTTTTQPPIITQTPQPASVSGGGDNGQSTYAVMAAIGAGLIPATFAALLPVFVGGRRRRKRSSDFGSVVSSYRSTAGKPLPEHLARTVQLALEQHDNR